MGISEWVNSQLKKIDASDIFVKAKEAQYTYQEFFSITDRIFEGLQIYGAYGKIIAVLENGIDLFFLYFMCMLNGKVIIPIDPQKNVSEIEKLIRQNKDNALVISEAEQPECNYISANILKDIRNRKIADRHGDTDIEKIFGQIDYQVEYLITFTSGTSGNSKGVVHSLGDLFSTIRAFQTVHPIGDNAVFGHVMPMTYMAGILNSIFHPFILGAKLVILGRFGIPLAIRFWKALSADNINVMWLSPTMLNMVLQTDRSKLGGMYCQEHKPQLFIGTAPLATALKKEFEERYQIPLYVSYGLTEALYVSVDTPDTSKRNDGNVGRLLPGVKVTEQNGEALIDTPWMFPRYTNEPTEPYFSGKYYKTGDLIKVHHDVLYIVGRKKDLIIKGGLNISPVNMEEEIMATGLVEDVAVFGKESGVEEIICCAYTCGKDSREIEKQLNKVLKKKLGTPYTVDAFYRMDKLLYNLNGKKDKAALKAWLEERKC